MPQEANPQVQELLAQLQQQGGAPQQQQRGPGLLQQLLSAALPLGAAALAPSQGAQQAFGQSFIRGSEEARQRAEEARQFGIEQEAKREAARRKAAGRLTNILAQRPELIRSGAITFEDIKPVLEIYAELLGIPEESAFQFLQGPALTDPRALDVLQDEGLPAELRATAGQQLFPEQTVTPEMFGTQGQLTGPLSQVLTNPGVTPAGKVAIAKAAGFEDVDESFFSGKTELTGRELAANSILKNPDDWTPESLEKFVAVHETTGHYDLDIPTPKPSAAGRMTFKEEIARRTFAMEDPPQAYLEATASYLGIRDDDEFDVNDVRIIMDQVLGPRIRLAKFQQGFAPTQEDSARVAQQYKKAIDEGPELVKNIRSIYKETTNPVKRAAKVQILMEDLKERGGGGQEAAPTELPAAPPQGGGALPQQGIPGTAATTVPREGTREEIQARVKQLREQGLDNEIIGILLKQEFSNLTE